MGARVSRIQVKRNRGSVDLSESNALVALAPYFFPLYTVCVIAAYLVLGVFFPVEQYNRFWLGMIGFTWAFHFSFTVASLLQQQTDIKAYGCVFSYALIALFNVLGISLWLVVVSDATLEGLVMAFGARLMALPGAARELFACMAACGRQ